MIDNFMPTFNMLSNLVTLNVDCSHMIDHVYVQMFVIVMQMLPGCYIKGVTEFGNVHH